VTGALRVLAALVLCCAVASAAVEADAPDGEIAAGLAVAPFERVAAPGLALPAVDALLADRLGTRGVERVVAPARLAVPADAEPDAGTVREWAQGAHVAAVVVGRITRLGDQVSVDVRVRAGDTGAVLATLVAEAPAEAAIAPAVEQLADEVVATLASGPGAAGPPAVASAPPAPEPAPAASGGGNPFGIDFDSGRPISIHSDELEAMQSGGARQLVFTRNVVVTQDDVTIRTSRLEAYYPPKASQPDRLVAQGSVRMRQGESEARCDNATFERARDLFVCRGAAELRDADGCVAGDRIEFDLSADTVKVVGGARVMINGADGAVAGSCR
jgi:lipopolysaccharide transport protein LptA